MAAKSPSGKGPSAWQTNRLAIKSLRGLVPLERLLLLELNDWASPDAPDPLRPIVWRPHAMLAQDLEVSSIGHHQGARGALSEGLCRADGTQTPAPRGSLSAPGSFSSGAPMHH